MMKRVFVILMSIAIVALNGCNDSANQVKVAPTLIATETATLAVTTPIPTRTQASRIPAAPQPSSDKAVQTATPKPAQISVTPAIPSTPTAAR